MFIFGVLCAALSGCVMFDVGVTNPVNGLTTVAVTPFFNLSEERSVDGRRFAQAYFTELQKTPGFQVVPVGVVEQAIHDHKLEMSGRDDALKLAEILHVDAIVVGAITDYSPYYPPRIGMQVSWYSPHEWTFAPGVPVYEDGRQWAMPRKKRSLWKKEPEVCPPAQPVMRMQSPDEDRQTLWNPWGTWGRYFRWNSASERETSPRRLIEAAPVTDSTQVTSEPPVDALEELPALPPPPLTPSLVAPVPLLGPPTPGFQTQAGNPVFDPRLPLMSYTRMFDGADPQLTAKLRDYVELGGDLRSGGWQGYLSRSEDFIRFTSHVMVVEMLQLHGGEAKRRVVVKMRRYR
ncbi:MAG: hypothetical protein Q8K78_05065 [Planctomycetaceae bacterium]|nr:hypothetical protein [Planctomycetaceae bacterium]